MSENEQQGGHSKKRQEARKEKFLQAFSKTLGNASSACISCGMSRSVYYKWLNSDNDFKDRIDDVLETSIDIVESELMKNILGGNIAGQIFYLKTKGRHRGYVEKVEIDTHIDIEPVQLYLPDNSRGKK